MTQSTALLEQKQTLSQQVSRVEKERREKVALRARLLSLKTKMQDVGTELYQTRIDHIDRAIPLIDQHLVLDERLLAAYERTLKIIDIELESRSAAEALPEGMDELLEARMRELSEIEAQTADIEIQLAANEEVERLLRGG